MSDQVRAALVSAEGADRWTAVVGEGKGHNDGAAEEAQQVHIRQIDSQTVRQVDIVPEDCAHGADLGTVECI